MADLKNSGVRDILIGCCDGLAGFEDAITGAFPHTVVQRWVVHYADLENIPGGGSPRAGVAGPSEQYAPGFVAEVARLGCTAVSASGPIVEPLTVLAVTNNRD